MRTYSSISLKVEKKRKKTDRYIGRMLWDNGGRDWNDVSTSHGMLPIAAATKS